MKNGVEGGNGVASPPVQVEERPKPSGSMIGLFVLKLVFLFCLLAAFVSLWASYRAGCGLGPSLIRAALAAISFAFLGFLLLRPLQRALLPESGPQETRGPSQGSPGQGGAKGAEAKGAAPRNP